MGASSEMKLSVFGLGYVGTVSSACLADLGHEVVGVDVSPAKVKLINDGKSPIVEAEIDGLVAKAVASGRLRATVDARDAVSASDVSFISVGTPSARSGAPSFAAVDQVTAEIGAAIRAKATPHTVVMRSTVPPGTTETRVAPALAAAAGRSIGQGLDLLNNPEFLREGSSVKDFHHPPFTLIGAFEGCSCEQVEALYHGVEAQVLRTSCRVAESVKYLSNVYHAVKLVFANEAGAILKSLGIDAREALSIFREDKVLNVSPAYLRPGFAFGGSCLPKDVRGFLAVAGERGVEVPFLGHVLASNQRHIDRAYDMIARGGRRPIALFGLAFKAGTDDLRESPLVTLAERLIGKGFALRIYDRSVEIARLVGSNRDYIDREIPHLEQLMAATPEAALADAEIIVIGHLDAPALAAVRSAAAGRRIVDLQGVSELAQLPSVDYEGICW